MLIFFCLKLILPSGLKILLLFDVYLTSIEPLLNKSVTEIITLEIS